MTNWFKPVVSVEDRDKAKKYEKEKKNTWKI